MFKYIRNLNLIILFTLCIFSCSKRSSSENEAAPAAPPTESAPVLVAKIILLESPNYDFGTITAGSNSAEKLFNISNTGDSAATQISLTLPMPFKFKGGTYPGLGGNCSSTLAIGSTCQVSVIFNPTTNGLVQSPFTVQYINGSSASSAEIQLLGAGQLPTPTRLSISSSAGFVINKCYPIKISSVTDLNVESEVSTDITVNLLVNNGTGLFYNTSDCTNLVSSTIITTGQKFSTVYFKSTTSPQNLTLIATANGLTSAQKSSAISNQTSQLILTSDSQIQLGVCQPIDITRLDSSGYAVYEDSILIVNLTQDGLASFFSDSNCISEISATTIEALSSSKKIYIKNTNLFGSINVSAASTDITIISANININFVSQLSW